MMRPRRGRRPGSSDTRSAIIEAARTVFANKGYDAATIRQIAEAAGVDPAMITHHFGSKEKLFMAALQVPLDPREQIEQVLDGPHEQLGERLVLGLLGIWDGPVGGAAAALLRSSIQHDWSAGLLRDFMTARAIGPIVARLDLEPAEARWRTGLVASQLVGLVMTRYILRFEAVSAAAPADLAAAMAPTIQRYLTGELLGPS